MSTTRDRLQELNDQNPKVLTGIDFVYTHPEYININDPIRPNQIRVDVHFHEPVPSSLTVPLTNLTINDISIYSAHDSARTEEVFITGMNWNGEVLELDVHFVSEYTLYRLFINDPNRIDLYYNNVTFQTTANCPSDLDCKPVEEECPPEQFKDFPINYKARDFWSYRKALLDFASLKYPDWKDRLEADAGIMMAEVMSAQGDEMAYYQDRVGREAFLETATQRRSVRNHTKLIDYGIHDGQGATTWINVMVAQGSSGPYAAGMEVWASSDNGLQIVYEIGRGLEEVLANKTYNVAAVRNAFAAHCWDEEDTCLPIGSTEIFIKGHHAGDIPFDDFGTLPTDLPGKWVLLITQPDASIPVRAQMVRVIQVANTTDPIFGENLTHLVWENGQATTHEMDMKNFEVRCNMLPAMSGKTFTEFFVVGQDVDSLAIPYNAKVQLSRAIERCGKDGALTYLSSLRNVENDILVRQGENIRETRPEIFLQEVEWSGVGWNPTAPVRKWTARPSLIGTYSSQSLSRDYTLDDGNWKRVVGYQRPSGEVIHHDYASNNGVTIRFGDGEFGMIPSEGTVFRVDYRVGKGRKDNVSINTITHFTPPPVGTGLTIESINNPFAVTNGMNPETIEAIRQLAPEAYRAITYRAVREEDYSEAIERLDTIQSAGTSSRWTGSWLSIFATPDPVNAVVLHPAHRREINLQLDRFRQAGREAYVMDPVYADIDLEVTVCVQANAYKGEVKKWVMEALVGKKGVRPKPGYFSPDRFTFGTALYRSTLEDTIQSVEGVKAVEEIYFSRRGWFDKRLFIDLKYEPGINTIIRIENNPLFPERGTIKLKMKGGA